LRARLCVQGRRKLYAFLDAHKVAYDRCGKLVVATDESEIERLDAIFEQGRTNDVEGLEKMTAAQAKAWEPQLRCAAAIHSPQSGVFDSHGYMLALQGEIEDRHGALALSTPFEGATPLPGGGFTVRAGGAEATELTCRLLVISASLGAQAAAAKIYGYPADQIPKLHYGKCNYFLLNGKAPFSRLIYPPPIHGALGTHYRRDLGGQARFGPDLQYVDRPDYTVDASRAEGFYQYVRRFWPGLPDGALSPDYVGIRPKIHGPGEPQPDFRIDGPEKHGIAGLVTLFGIESPGLTSSLAIGEEVSGKLP
jgi:L-2-hydroxyglutarate oxidase LhgO